MSKTFESTGTSDPFAIVTRIATTQASKPEVIGKTEVIKNSLNPQWTKVFKFDYELGTPTKVAVSIFDEVRKGDNKPMGSAVFDIDEILGARGNTKARKLNKGGTLFASVRKSTGTGLLRLKMKGHKLKNVEGLVSKSDPFFELSRQVNSAGALTWDNVFRSQPIHNNLSPIWEDVTIELSTLCGGDLNLPILVTVFDHESSGKHKAMGQFESSVNGLVSACTRGSEDLSKAIKLRHKGKATGDILVLKADVSDFESPASLTRNMERLSVSSVPSSSLAAGRPNFVDYIAGGCALNVVVAIDFTGSNGDPRKPGTLHHIDPSSMNDYEKAISSIVTILSKYDSDQRFPVLGFGAKYGGVVKHTFQVGPNEEAHGVQGVLDAYNSVFQTGLVMTSPTVFTEVIENAATRAQRALVSAQQKGCQAYTILLIVTDGAVSDSQATASCLNRVSDNPLSVVIVGVGNADFAAMEFLDDLKGGRDIAQFVQFNKQRASTEDLSSVTLREIPEQLVGYFQSKGIQPLPAIVAKGGDIIVEEEQEIDLSLDITEDEIVVLAGGREIHGW